VLAIGVPQINYLNSSHSTVLCNWYLIDMLKKIKENSVQGIYLNFPNPDVRTMNFTKTLIDEFKRVLKQGGEIVLVTEHNVAAVNARDIFLKNGLSIILAKKNPGCCLRPLEVFYLWRMVI